MPVPDVSHSESQYPLHPEGKFPFVVKFIEEKYRESDGELIALMTLEPHGSGDRPNMLVSFTLNENWYWKLRDFLQAVNMPTEGGYDWSGLYGKKVYAYVIHNSSKGKTYANVQNWEPYTTDTPIEGLTPTAGKDGLPF
jgi:hypothetical protein